jgi:geranylgeranyl transferase type-1 subunit beta
VYTDVSAPHLIMTYCALLSLAILRDDFAQLDRAGLVQFVRACQAEDGGYVDDSVSPAPPSPVSIPRSPLGGTRARERALTGTGIRFTTTPGTRDSDLRMCYCAFVVCSLLNDWSGMDVDRAVAYIKRCRVRMRHLSSHRLR